MLEEPPDNMRNRGRHQNQNNEYFNNTMPIPKSNKEILLNENYNKYNANNVVNSQKIISNQGYTFYSKKEETHNYPITVVLNLENGYIATASWDETIKIW